MLLFFLFFLLFFIVHVFLFGNLIVYFPMERSRIMFPFPKLKFPSRSRTIPQLDLAGILKISECVGIRKALVILSEWRFCPCKGSGLAWALSNGGESTRLPGPFWSKEGRVEGGLFSMPSPAKWCGFGVLGPQGKFWNWNAFGLVGLNNVSDYAESGASLVFCFFFFLKF